MDKESEGFAYWGKNFPKPVGLGPQMKQLFHHQYFSTKFYRKMSLKGIWKSAETF